MPKQKRSAEDNGDKQRKKALKKIRADCSEYAAKATSAAIDNAFKNRKKYSWMTGVSLSFS